MNININKGAFDNVLDLINATNATSFTATDITLGAPATWTDPEGINARNTQVTVTATPESAFTGEIPVRFTRLDLQSQSAASDLDYTLQGNETVGDILSAVAAKLGVVEESVELDIVDVPQVESGETATILLKATDDSLLYVGDVLVTVFPAVNDIGDSITNQDLDGFDPETEEEESVAE